jgi:hypothetical protein
MDQEFFPPPSDQDKFRQELPPEAILAYSIGASAIPQPGIDKSFFCSYEVFK